MKLNSIFVTDKEEIIKAIKEFREDIGEVPGVREGRMTLERKNAEELHARISMKSRSERIVKKKKKKNVYAHDQTVYCMSFTGHVGEVMIDEVTELLNQVWKEKREEGTEKVECMWNKNKNEIESANYWPITFVNTVHSLSFSAEGHIV